MGAAYYGHDHVVELLIERGADCNIKNSVSDLIITLYPSSAMLELELMILLLT
jgi:ankyrin repeat protein